MKSSNINILVTGANQDNFVIPLFQKIKEKSAKFAVGRFIIIDAPYKPTTNSNIFNKFHFLYGRRIRNYPIKYLLSETLNILFDTKFWHQIFLKKGLSISNAFQKTFSKKLIYKLYLKEASLFKNYHIINFHYCDPSFSELIEHIPSFTKVICSIWGSDLMRISGELEYYRQKKMFERANIITLQSIEMREIILAKYGRHLKPKIRITLFGTDNEFFDNIDLYDNLADIQKFKNELGIAFHKKLITIGHNANPFNNHLTILNHVKHIKQKENTVVLLPFTYGCEDFNYINQVKEYCENEQIEYRIFQKFLSINDLALLRIVTDVMIHMPESDAQSAAMIETLYAGNIVITGSWLPYGNLRRREITYYEIEEFSYLARMLDNVLENIEDYIPNKEHQKKQILNHYHIDKTTNKWLKIFNEVSS